MIASRSFACKGASRRAEQKGGRVRLPDKPAPGYGSVAQKLHRQNVINVQGGGMDPLQNPSLRRSWRTDFLAAQVVEIADTVREGKKVRISQKDGTTEEHGDQVDRSRLMMDARKWLASKLAPKKYGDKVAAELSGPDGGPIQEHLTVEYIRQKD
jgi:hypothetical protein